MIRYLLDTNTISEPSRERPNERVMQRHPMHQREMAIPSVVWHELVYGLERLPPGRKRNYFESYLLQVVHASLPFLPYDAAAANWHGRERARLEKLGQPRPFADGMVAAVALRDEVVGAGREGVGVLLARARMRA